MEQVEQDARAQEKGTNANTVDIGCMQLNQELQRRRLERLEGIVHLQEQALLAQERALGGFGEGEKKLGRELRVQNPRQKEKEPACPSGACPTAKGQRTSTGKPSKGETLTGPGKTSLKEDRVYKGGKGTVKKPPGGGKSLPQP